MVGDMRREVKQRDEEQRRGEKMKQKWKGKKEDMQG